MKNVILRITALLICAILLSASAVSVSAVGIDGNFDVIDASVDNSDGDLIDKVVFWCILIIGGIILPLGIIGFSAIMLCLKKSFKLFWRIAAIVGAVWLCSAISITLIILI